MARPYRTQVKMHRDIWPDVEELPILQKARPGLTLVLRLGSLPSQSTVAREVIADQVAREPISWAFETAERF
jgi:hypothetical protein